MMNWQHLVYFRTVAEKKSFSEAAENLFITPSALSKAIRSLEEELGFPLFEKQGRTSVLTRYGKDFYPYVCRATEAINEGMESIHERMGIQSGHVNISGIYTLCADYIPQQLKYFKERYPNISFSISYKVSGIILQDLLKGNIDLGFCGDFDKNTVEYKDIEYHIIKQEELIVIVPRNHPLSGQRYVDFDKLADENFISWKNVNSGLNEIFLDTCKSHDFIPNISYEVHDDYTILEMVANGLGIALIPDTPSLLRSNVSILRFRDTPPVRTLHMVWKKNRYLSPAAVTFKNFILDSLEENKEF